MVRVVRRVHKTERLFFTTYRYLGTFTDGSPKIVIYFDSDSGSKCVWTPEWSGETKELFQRVGQAGETSEPQIEIQQPREEIKQVETKEVSPKTAVDYHFLAIKVAESLKRKTSLSYVREVAEAVFKFDASPHTDLRITDTISQEIFDWIMTLSEQSIDNEEKLRLAKKFIGYLAPADSPLKKLAE